MAYVEREGHSDNRKWILGLVIMLIWGLALVALASHAGVIEPITVT